MTKQLPLKRLLLTIFVLLSFTIQQAKAQDKAVVLHELNDLLINTVMVDFFTPPVASRIYAYPNIAFYECIRLDDPAIKSLSGKLNGLGNLPAPPANTNIDNFIAAAVAFSYTAQSLVGSEYKLESWRQHFVDSVLFGKSNAELVKNSLLYGKLVADSVVAWAKRDNYNQSRAMPRFTLSNEPGTWQPTPADYAQAIEPFWNTIRPFTLNNCSQFSPAEKLPFSLKKNSSFYKTMMEVYEIGKKLDTTQKAIAKYWDDNPNVSVNMGHLNYFIHKISPGGHWLMITKQACEEKNETVSRSSLAYTLTSIALFDGFISCWDEKFKTNLIRPITVINDHVDKNWQPYIQTPPFPEFTSGHAVISNAAATVLTRLFGDNYEFTDATEIPFGNETRRFKSFYEASAEVSWSRVYGGIHYPETARISIAQGKEIGNYVLKTLYAAAIK
ncbi:MAG: vanadium-dependent haloperoxidase [Chitinophagaceae bacterium]|nr:vanadium-dependent haloperoxidase [Chitinophagaceae bacterium]